MSIPETINALLLHPSTKSVSVGQVPTPTASANEILVRVHAIALNPVDTLFVHMPLAQQDERVLGVDFAGVVVAAGEGVKRGDKRGEIGARVAGFVQGACSANARPGAFADYVAIPYDLTWLVPDTMALDSAAATTMCAVTAAQGVFYRQGLPSPFWKTPGWNVDGSSEITYLVYGGSASIGQYAAQMVKIAAETSGRKVKLIGVASARQHAFLQNEYGYDLVLDYRDDSWVKTVTELGGADYAFDAISEGETWANVQAALSPRARPGSVVAFLAPPADLQVKVAPVYGAAWEALGAEVDFMGTIIPVNEDARAFAAAFYDYIAEHPLKPNPVRRMPGGLERVAEDGFALLGGGLMATRKQLQRDEEYMRPISGDKITYTLVKSDVSPRQ